MALPTKLRKYDMNRTVPFGLMFVCLLTVTTAVSQATVLNPGFESGDFTAWSTIGQTTVEGTLHDGPSEGSFQALITNDGASVSPTDVANFAGVTVAALEPLSVGAGGATNLFSSGEGSAIKQSITVNAGDTLSFDWQFLTNEGVGSSNFSDFAFVVIDGVPTKLVDINDLGLFGGSGSPFNNETEFNTFTHVMAGAGTFDLVIGIGDQGDTLNGNNSHLLLDNFRLTTTAIPEPASLGLLAMGSLILLRRSNKQRTRPVAA